TPDGKQLVSASLDRTLKLWDGATGNLVREFKAYDEKKFPKGHHDGVFCLAISPDGKRLATDSSDRSLKLWNIADGTVIRDFTHPEYKNTPAAPRSSAGAASSSTQSGSVVPASPFSYPFAHPGWIYGVRFSADGKSLISVGTAPRNQGFLAVWNV